MNFDDDGDGGEGRDLFGRNEKMASDLDALVRLVRRGVEGLQDAANGEGPSFDTFAFALQDWDS